MGFVAHTCTGHGQDRFSRTPIVPHAPAWECGSRSSASQEDAERPDRHTHAEHGYDSVIPDDDRSSRSSVGMQFTTHRVARGRRASRPACPRWSLGTMVLSLPTIVPHAPAWECSSRRSASQEDAERPDRHTHAEHGYDSVIPADDRSSRSGVGMQFTTLCVARGRGAPRPACPRWNMGTMVLPLPTIVPHAPAWECSSRRSASQEDAERPDRRTHAEHGYDSVIPADDRSSRSGVGMQFTTLCVARGRGAPRPACPRWSMGTMALSGRLPA
ncbi:hypothetical protein SAMN05444505_104180 [Pseudomonas syringae]|uniref:DUF1534 domain-containing protein n=1 Tax=Pseudomonas syringae TaxID=317 RepID=A0AB37ZK04_PSESX|nr:hypothetical protein SAMN05444505_104180 [Pseudomonas syringae]SDN16910.1 hypothetical protein SAMN05444502_104180 [Pseudomonas sp. BS3759]